MIKVLLIGQPNSGKSTIFNSVIGYKSISSNIAGVTVEFTTGKTVIDYRTFELVDLPGTYSLISSDEAEALAVNYLLEEKEDFLILNVIDSSVLTRSLELTIQLLELQKPMVVALNMIDDAERKGIEINADKLSEILGVPVIKTIASKGIGVSELFDKISIHPRFITKQNPFYYSEGAENMISDLKAAFMDKFDGLKISKRFIAIQFIENNLIIHEKCKKLFLKEEFENIIEMVQRYETECGKKLNIFFHKERHLGAFQIFEEVAKVGQKRKKDFLVKLDDIFMHSFWGYLSLASIMFIMFQAIFSFGGFAEPLFLENFGKISDLLANYFGQDSLLHSITHGAIVGFGGGIAIVIPYLLPFFLILAFMEDTGYLARIAYLLDSIMHKIGLHGLSVVPLILGYGCTVPAIISTRILKSRKDKFITAALSTLIPCTARMTTIFALVGFFISIKAAIMIYVINLIIVAVSGKILSKIFNEVSPGFILEMPKYHLPSIKVLLNKTWYRLKEFVVIAWPLLIIGSIILELINYFNLTSGINSFLSPFTEGILGLPAIVGITLIFGIMRKELTIILLFAAIGTNDVLKVMTVSQIFSYTIFITFYVPCLATFAALVKEIKLSNALLVSFFSFVIAVILAVFFRFIGVFF